MHERDDDGRTGWAGFSPEEIDLGEGFAANGGLLPVQAFEVVRLPPSLLGFDQRRIWQRVQTMQLLGIAPRTPVERLVLETLRDVRAKRLKITVQTFLTGVALAVAHVSKYRVPTHTDGIARHLGVRKATLLAVRKLAIKRAQALGLRFAPEGQSGLPPFAGTYTPNGGIG